MSSRFISPFFDAGNGITPSSGAKLFFFELDGVTPRNTYSDEAATIANANPVISDANGLFSDIWIVGTYKVILQDKNSVQIWVATPVRESTAGDISYNQGGTGATERNVEARLQDYVSPKDFGGIGNGAANDAPAFVLANSNGEGIIVTAGTYKISDNLTISQDIAFMPGALLTVDSGKTVTLSGDVIAGDTQEIFTGSGNVGINSKSYPIHWYSTAAMAIRSSTAADNIQIHKNVAFNGVDITKRLNFWGNGREF